MTVDPRPRVCETDGRTVVLGGRCSSCAFPTLADTDRCPLCQELLDESGFGPEGEVVASSVLHVGLPGRTPPYVLAHVVLDDGPRVLVHMTGGRPTLVGARVALAGLDGGDLVATSLETR